MRAEIGSQLSCSREVDYGHRVSPMLAGTVIKKSCSSIGPILEGRAYYALRKLWILSAILLDVHTIKVTYDDN